MVFVSDTIFPQYLFPRCNFKSLVQFVFFESIICKLGYAAISARWSQGINFKRKVGISLWILDWEAFYFDERMAFSCFSLVYLRIKWSKLCHASTPTSIDSPKYCVSWNVFHILANSSLENVPNIMVRISCNASILFLGVAFVGFRIGHLLFYIFIIFNFSFHQLRWDTLPKVNRWHLNKSIPSSAGTSDRSENLGHQNPNFHAFYHT